MVQWFDLQCFIVVFPDHTRFFKYRMPFFDTVRHVYKPSIVIMLLSNHLVNYPCRLENM